ncbi:hypothetical protein EMPS_07563 [Entomortierella parvispora]|uniref:Ecp2 effector protein domain-containing protein n=1 Tax=Entomortierella parvispora TaxID=205924 RepID=A0A9P3LYT6_9FUNG|nr:hypothetical protein EMPS_07563 [Entomortierella parvispora]
MKFSIVAAISAITLAVTSDAALMKLYNLQDIKGSCDSFPISKYDWCYTISQFYLPRSASFLNQDPNSGLISVTFFETGNCGGKYTRISGNFGTNVFQQWPQLGTLSGIAGSVMVTKGGKTGQGTINQYHGAEIAQLGSC